MPDDVIQMELSSPESEETRYIRSIKEALAKLPAEKGDRVCVTFKLSRDRHGQLLAACAKQGITMTDLLTLYIDHILPKLQRAHPTTVPGYEPDKRTKPPAWAVRRHS